MLETVVAFLNSVSDMSFAEYYRNYVHRIELQSIEAEFDYLLSHNDIDLLGLERLINKSLDELVRSSGK